MQQWAEEHGTWRAHGVRLDLMHGNRRVAAATLMTLFEIGSVRSSVNHSVWCASRDSCADRPISRPWGMLLR